MPRAVGMPPDVVADVWASAMFRCEACWLDGYVTGAGLQVHHRLPRSRARNLHDRHNCVLLCGEHHDLAHARGGAGWPWLVEGSVVRGEYVGPDPLYRATYPAPGFELVLPPVLLVAASYPAAAPRAVAWAWARARDFGVLR